MACDASFLVEQKAGMSCLSAFHCCLIWDPNVNSEWLLRLRVVFYSHCEDFKASLSCSFCSLGLVWKLMARDNLVPLNFALVLAAGIQAETWVICLG